jgi:D-glycero-D-manno-heptose 1,7-bisphosphate phosphatase
MIRQAVILCGGLDTRLGALTAQTPKPLLPVGENPFLDVLLFELGRHGLRQILLLAGFAADRVREYVIATPLKTQFGLEIEVMSEPQRAGTGGALWHARDRLDEVFLLLNGGSWFDINLLELAARTVRDPSATAGIALTSLCDPSLCNVVEIDREKITKFHSHADHQGSCLGNGGVYVCRRALVDRLVHVPRSRRTHFRASLVTESWSGYRSTDISSTSGFLNLWHLLGRICHGGDGGPPPFSTATGSSIMTMDMSGRASVSAGSMAASQRSNRSTMPVFLSLS